MEYKGILIPQDIESMMSYSTPADRERLMIIGAMRTWGIYERTHTTHLNLGVTVFRFGMSVQNSQHTAKELITEWLQACYGILKVSFHQDKYEQRISNEERAYFHARGTHME